MVLKRLTKISEDMLVNMKRKFHFRLLCVLPILGVVVLYAQLISWLIENGSSETASGRGTNAGLTFQFIPSNAGLMLSEHGKIASKQKLQSNITLPTKHSYFTKMKFGHVYILGVAAGNSSIHISWNLYKVYASIDMTDYKIENFRCCLMFQRKSESEFIMKKPLHTGIHRNGCALMPVHVICPNVGQETGETPAGVALTLDSLSCDTRHVAYVTPYYPLLQTETKLAIGTKLAYLDVKAELIIEWMETYKYLGVDKVITYYVDNLNKDALKVLKYYESTGILDLYHHEPAAATNSLYPRHYDIETSQQWCDLLMTVHDSYEKMFGYTYFGIIDHDEFLIPAKDRTIKQMLADLFTAHEDAAGFTFKTQFYHTSWGPSGDVNDLILGRYINKTASGPEDDHSKSIYLPNSIRPGAVRTLYTKPVKGKLMYLVPKEEGFIRHYHECREESRSQCLFVFKRVQDTSSAEWSMRILDNVHKARQAIFGTTNVKYDIRD